MVLRTTCKLLTMPLNLRDWLRICRANPSFWPSISLGFSARPSVMISSWQRGRIESCSTHSNDAIRSFLGPKGLCSTETSRSL